MKHLTKTYSRLLSAETVEEADQCPVTDIIFQGIH